MTISAEAIADSIGNYSPRLVTMKWRYPKFIHGEVMTHRVFSRNASSSRAIPVERLIKDVIDDPVYPMHWGKNQPGMSAVEECDAPVKLFEGMIGEMNVSRKDAWDYARTNAIAHAQTFAKAGYHKQIVNRLIEPFCHINTLVTSTEWSNFFALRCHKDAQPEMRLLAEHARFAMERSEPIQLKPGQWHLPFCSDVHGKECTVKDDDAIKVSVARCARVSYMTQEGKPPVIEDDLKLYERLVGAVPLHASPAEHQAMPDGIVPQARPGRVTWVNPNLHGNFTGWIQYRKTLKGENQ